MGTALHCGIGEKEKNKNKNNLNAVYHIQNNMHAHKRKNLFQRNISLCSELVRKQKASTIPVLKRQKSRFSPFTNQKSNTLMGLQILEL